MNTKSISKFLSLVLRHDPSKAGISLDENGWVLVDDLLSGMNDIGKQLSRADLEHVVATNDKKRFAFSADGLKIRASQGHSVDIDLAIQPMTPPDLLYHGTAKRNLDSIMHTGLTPQSRRHVHLSAETETARKVGMRHGSPIILLVHASAMSKDGIAFYRSENGVWLTANVEPAYLSVMDRQ